MAAMLYEIAQGAKNPLILLSPQDNVAIARAVVAPGQHLPVGDETIFIKEPIAAGHKVALRKIESGEPVFRYGNLIGFATKPIEPGEHVHVHNLGYEEIDTKDEAPFDLPIQSKPVSTARFLGYQRADGRVGTRNYIAVVAASNCAAHTSELIAQS